ncbi:MAG: radical SAM protein [Nanoarchaeota archaeon]|nr:radical SAM protein [Nanoarchaeota archaeon]
MAIKNKLENKFHSYNKGKLPKGCAYCVKGEKLVMFVTGICPRKCCFCPVSDEKYQKDVIFANEQTVDSFDDVIMEAKAMNAKGAGVTGGDPLARLDRTVSYIKKLKEKFGKNFHIHLYTSLNLVSEKTLKKLYLAGLDEIRFHLDLDSKKLWKKLEITKKFNWDIGVELPLIPTKEKNLKEIIDYIHDKVDFLNLNELEVADNNHSNLKQFGFHVKNNMSYAIKGSLELGLGLIGYAAAKGYKISMHVCTAKLKDAVQLSERIKRQGKIVKHDFDIIDDEGLLTRGALYLPELKPGFGYRKKLMKADKEKLIKKLGYFANEIKNKLKLSNNDFIIDKNKLRILLSKNNTIKNKKIFLKMNLIPAIVVEYPTADQFEVEIEFLE